MALDVRPMHAWEFYDDQGAEELTWAEETRSARGELGGATPWPPTGSARRASR